MPPTFFPALSKGNSAAPDFRLRFFLRSPYLYLSFPGKKKSPSSPSLGSLQQREAAKAEVGDQVLVAGQKQGTVRFYGKTDFAPGEGGLWAEM